MKEINDGIKKAHKALMANKKPKVNIENVTKEKSVNIDYKSPIFQALKLIPISELDYII